jgi:histidine ammonia-lyase
VRILSRIVPSMTARVQLDGAADLTADAYESIVYGGAMITLTADAIDRVMTSREAFIEHLRTGVICYGVNTGLGAMSTIDLTDEQRLRLPRHTLLGRASGTGPSMPAAIGRGALLAKLVQFLDGHSAVSGELCRAIAARLNRGMAPAIPSHGFGMAGEIIPLSHAVRPLIGEGNVFAANDTVQTAREWYSENGIGPYEPQLKEGLSLISGSGVGPALAWHLGRDAAVLVATANLVAACSIEGLAAPVDPYSTEASSLNPDPHVAMITADLRRHLGGSEVTRQSRQAPVSYRVTPQVHAVAVEAIERLRTTALDDIRANGDNPAFFDGTDGTDVRLTNSGNFHGAALAARVEAATIAIVHLGNVAEKRLYRLLDERASGLSRQLARQPGLDAGLITVHKAAIGYGAALRMLAAPASVMQADSSFGQEDVMSLVFPALDRLAEAVRFTEAVLAHELFVATVAIDERGERPGADVAVLLARVRQRVATYDGDRSYAADLDALIALVHMTDG